MTEEEKMKEYTCPKCKQKVEYDEEQNIAEVVDAHLANCPEAPEATPYHRITDVVPEDILKGNIVTIEEILGKEILVKDISWHDSTFKEDAEYLSLTIDLDGEEKVLNTGATRVVEVFKHVDEKDLPIYVSFEKVTLTGGKRVYRVK